MVLRRVVAARQALPVSVAPVLIGTSAAYAAAGWRFDWYWGTPIYNSVLVEGFEVPEILEWRWAQAGLALLALVVVPALQVVMDRALDYTPGHVTPAASASFILLRPVATLGTTYTQIGHLTRACVLGALGTGAVACAVLVANSLRVEPADGQSGTAAAARRFYLTLVATSFATVGLIALTVTPWAWLGLLALPWAVPPVRAVRTGTAGPGQLPVLRDTARLDLISAIMLSAGLVLARH